MSRLTVIELAETPFPEADRLQKKLHAKRLAGVGDDSLLLLSHPPVFTLGRRACECDLLWDETERTRRGITVCRTDRGGAVTYHGPGQLIAYPIIALDPAPAVRAFVRMLEDAMLETAAHFRVAAERRAGRPGIWTERGKLGAVGLRIDRGVSRHGISLNISPELGHFAGIVSCGAADTVATSLLAEMGLAPDLGEAGRVFAEALAGRLGLDCRFVTLDAAVKA